MPGVSSAWQSIQVSLPPAANDDVAKKIGKNKIERNVPLMKIDNLIVFFI
jgi:hypothetical protein